MTESSKPPLSSSAILALLYGALGVVSLFIPGSQWFMLVGALFADLMAMLAVNMVLHFAPSRWGEAGMNLVNSIAKFVGSLLIGVVFITMIGEIVTEKTFKNPDSGAFYHVLFENMPAMWFVFFGASVAYVIRLRLQFQGKTSADEAFFEMRHRIFLLLGFSVIAVIGTSIGMNREVGIWVLFALFIIRAAMEFLGRRFWKRLL